MNRMEHLAMMIAVESFGTMLDETGRLKVQHSLRVGASGRTPEQRIVGFLHDVVEDTKMTLHELKQRGIHETFVEAVNALTRRDGEPYGTFIQRVVQNELASYVKLNDINDNLSRVDQLPDPARVKRLTKRYLRARNIILTNLDVTAATVQIQIDHRKRQIKRVTESYNAHMSEHLCIGQKCRIEASLWDSKRQLSLDLADAVMETP